MRALLLLVLPLLPLPPVLSTRPAPIDEDERSVFLDFRSPRALSYLSSRIAACADGISGSES